MAPSPEDVQRRLLAAGMRPVSNVVDATNYVMLELGKPTHAFDAGAVARDASGRAGLVVRTARDGERLETLDHVERRAHRRDAAHRGRERAARDRRGHGRGRVRGGGVDDDVIIESAVFDPVSIRRTAFRYALRSEASLRFEKGQESRLARIGADRVAELIAAWAGGAVAAGRIDTAPDEPAPARVGYRPARVDRLLGTNLDADAQAALLARVGIVSEPFGAGIDAARRGGSDPARASPRRPARHATRSCPSWRRDLLVEADIAEEVVRLAGYETVAGKTPDTAMPHVRPNPLELRDALRRALAGGGPRPRSSRPPSCPPRRPQPLGWPVRAADGVPGEVAIDGPVVTVTNPLSERHAVLRRGLVGSLLDVLALNERHGRGDVAIFEVGKGYAKAADGTPAEWWRLAFLLAGAIGPGGLEPPARALSTSTTPRGSWSCWPGPRPAGPGLRALHGRGAAPSGPGRARRGRRAAAPGSSASSTRRSSPRGTCAQSACSSPSSPSPGSRAGSWPRSGWRRSGGSGRSSATSPSSCRRRSRRRTSAATLRSAGGERLQRIALFDIYRGAPLGPGEKSLAWRAVFAADERALTDEEVDADVARLVAAAASAHGARLRT